MSDTLKKKNIIKINNENRKNLQFCCTYHLPYLHNVVLWHRTDYPGFIWVPGEIRDLSCMPTMNELPKQTKFKYSSHYTLLESHKYWLFGTKLILKVIKKNNFVQDQYYLVLSCNVVMILEFLTSVCYNTTGKNYILPAI